MKRAAADCDMKGEEASRAKRPRHLPPNQPLEIVIDLNSADAEYKVSSMVDEEVEPRRTSPGSPNSQTSSSPDFSVSTSEDEDTGQSTAG
jgi:hypothetical protein